ncbi:PDT-domain-containing protein [Trichodelitschia bisporula]|uniref:prephenate dehydratase n=1 Tax=Trichodelitschia bisporula TaxID=703511 RepID=A0A6G1I8R4_9PEZI|nr:PDT-domain-containing protein [Trichodelitschia bisporula]
MAEVKVAYLGPPATYTHQAALQVFRPTATLVPYATFPSIFAALRSGSATHAVVPVENSTNGPVIAALDLLLVFSRSPPTHAIVRETYVPVTHCLLGRPNPLSSETPSPDLSHIRALYSHPQAWSQCTPFLDTHFPPGKGVSRHDTDSTARAAEIVAADESGASAAICSPLAAEVYGLSVLAPGIQARERNQTRFVVLGPRSQGGGEKGRGNWRVKTGFTIGVKGHRNVGLLSRMLVVLERRGVEVAFLNLRPGGQGGFNYAVVLEVFARRGEGSFDTAVREIEGMGGVISWVGEWEAAGIASREVQRERGAGSRSLLWAGLAAGGLLILLQQRLSVWRR